MLHAKYVNQKIRIIAHYSLFECCENNQLIWLPRDNTQRVSVLQDLPRNQNHKTYKAWWTSAWSQFHCQYNRKMATYFFMWKRSTCKNNQATNVLNCDFSISLNVALSVIRQYQKLVSPCINAQAHNCTWILIVNVKHKQMYTHTCFNLMHVAIWQTCCISTLVQKCF